ncbi:hypothetical protein [Helicobacter sp. WB40]|uniref:hypothetical protein n=1 Tax=Helicobacter sp. WB40 TaxID=3004130 RepID=UPI0022EBE085|nr:hypothetical protein [Helicobacter sp. WB40]MDA3967354.1 hypothetical protein [Helicobacter sp. WB40]
MGFSFLLSVWELASVVFWFSIVFFAGFFIARFFKKNLVFRDGLKPYCFSLIVVLLVKIYFVAINVGNEILVDMEHIRKQIKNTFRETNKEWAFVDIEFELRRYDNFIQAQNNSLKHMKEYSGFFSGLDRFLYRATDGFWGLDSEAVEYMADSFDAIFPMYDLVDYEYFYDTGLFASYKTNLRRVVFARQRLLRNYADFIMDMENYEYYADDKAYTQKALACAKTKYLFYAEQLEYLKDKIMNKNVDFDYNEYEEFIEVGKKIYQCK